MKRRMMTAEDAKPCAKQHNRPCGDCPFRKDSIPGWLGSLSADQWVKDLHGETRIDCHTKIGPQCAGAAIYRSNVAKSPRDKSLLVLPADRTRVFSSPVEFREHHDSMGEVKG